MITSRASVAPMAELPTPVKPGTFDEHDESESVGVGARFKKLLGISFAVAWIFVIPRYVSEGYLFIVQAASLVWFQRHRYLQRQANEIRIFPKFMEISSLVCSLGVVAWFFATHSSAFLKNLDERPALADKLISDVLTTALLALIMLVSIALGRPFTIEYAKDHVPERIWDSVGFYSRQLRISAAYLVMTVVLIGVALLRIFVLDDWNSTASTIFGLVIPFALAKFAMLPYIELLSEEGRAELASGRSDALLETTVSSSS